ncbi:MAG: 4-hydroxythreonine-4-phosphate dehydrogenase PdxA [Bacteriovoracaceae bacterium]|nr:4-hydroxythreonine-4-phosphate dehydrogenase PdxA [Bacteriovoracaceae bacterium]
MILVTQGHEVGIGLEVYFKSLLLGPSSWTTHSALYCYKTSVKKTISRLGLPAEISGEGIHLPTGLLKCRWLSPSKFPESSVAMYEALGEIELNTKNVLFTLPTTKSDLVNPKNAKTFYLGHTELLRHHYKNNDLAMYFTSPHLDVLLLTDHIPLKSVCKQVTKKALLSKMKLSLQSLKEIEPRLKNIYFSGINPHAGEDGLLGTEEQKLKNVFDSLISKKFNIQGPFPGDSLFVNRKDHHDLLVYMFHDQGLAPFKAMMGTVGANITLGLPFIRLSVDHGTAFSLYGKNIANSSGAYFCMRKAMDYLEITNGQNSHIKSKSS